MDLTFNDTDNVYLNDLVQGDTFYYKDELFLKLPPFVECQGNPANAVNTKTGSMIWINPSQIIKKI